MNELTGHILFCMLLSDGTMLLSSAREG